MADQGLPIAGPGRPGGRPPGEMPAARNSSIDPAQRCRASRFGAVEVGYGDRREFNAVPSWGMSGHEKPEGF